MSNVVVENSKDDLATKHDGASASASTELVTKHPLQNEWVYWYYKPDKSKKEWSENLIDVTKFNTVEDFWALYNHIELVRNLTPGSDYAVFKNGIKPMWEDDGNKHGGNLMFLFKRDQQMPDPRVDDMWLEILLCIIGEAFGDESDHVCGAVANVRRTVDRISIWTKDWRNEHAIRKIGRVLKERTGYKQVLVYSKHEMNDRTSYLYTI